MASGLDYVGIRHPSESDFSVGCRYVKVPEAAVLGLDAQRQKRRLY